MYSQVAVSPFWPPVESALPFVLWPEYPSYTTVYNAGSLTSLPQQCFEHIYSGTHNLTFLLITFWSFSFLMHCLEGVRAGAVGITDYLVGIATYYILSVRVSKLEGSEIYCAHPERPRGLPSLLYSGYLNFPGVKRPGRGGDHPTPYSAELLMGWRCNSAFQLCLHGNVVG